MAHSCQGMQVLLMLTTEFGLARKLKFNPDKSAVLLFSVERLGQPVPLTIQSEHVGVLDSYEYLGIKICDGANYPQEREKIWKRVARRALQQLPAQSLWTFNRFEISRIQLKATIMLWLTSPMRYSHRERRPSSQQSFTEHR